MGNHLTYLKQPATEKDSEIGASTDGFQFAVTSMQGWRRNMEDAHCAEVDFSKRTANAGIKRTVDGAEVAKDKTDVTMTEKKENTESKEETPVLSAEEKAEKEMGIEDPIDVAPEPSEPGYPEGTMIFGVFDGHGGKGVSKYVAKQIGRFIRSKWSKDKEINAVLKEAFLDLDKHIDTNEAARNEVKDLDGPSESIEVPILEANAFFLQNDEDDEIDIDMEETLDELDEDGLAADWILDEDGKILSTMPMHTIVPDLADVDPTEEKITDLGEKKDETTTAEAEKKSETEGKTESKEAQNVTTTGVENKGEANTDKKNEETETKATATEPVLKTSTTTAGPSPSIEESKEVSEESKKEEKEEGDSIDSMSDVTPDDLELKDAENESKIAELQRTLQGLDEDEEQMGPVIDIESYECIEEADHQRGVYKINPNVLRGDASPEGQGCTGVVVVYLPPTTEAPYGTLVTANAGDSRAVLCRGDQAYALSEDHKPDDAIERERIVNAGGTVEIMPGGDIRVCGDLNLSRSFGDFRFKRNNDVAFDKQIITSDPDITITPLTKTDKFVVMGCDGIWETNTSQAVVDWMIKNEAVTVAESQLVTLTEGLCDHSMAPSMEAADFDGSGCDNMTAILIRFPNFDEEGEGNKRRKVENEETAPAAVEA